MITNSTKRNYEFKRRRKRRLRRGSGGVNRKTTWAFKEDKILLQRTREREENMEIKGERERREENYAGKMRLMVILRR